MQFNQSTNKYPFDPEKIEAEAILEAISTLGYLKISALDDMLTIVKDCREKGFKAVATTYRKRSPQINTHEKRLLGLRANTFMSVKALDDLTEEGIAAPLEAHFLTLWRSTETISRAQQIISAIDYADSENIAGHVYLSKLGAFRETCDECHHTYRSRERPNNLSPFPPQKCQREGCGMYFGLYVDWPALAK